MEYHIYRESSIWREARTKRVIRFVRILSYLMITLALSWVVLSVQRKFPFIAIAAGSTAILGCAVLLLVRKGRVAQAKYLMLLVGGMHYLTVCIFASGYGILGGTAHFGFIALALAAYFLLYDRRIGSQIVPVIFFALFFAFHFGYAPFHPQFDPPAEEEHVIHLFDVVTTLVIIAFITRHFVAEITRSEDALSLSADRLEGLVASMLPPAVADRIKREGKTFADEFHECSVLFADVIGFTSWSESHPASEVVHHLNNVFARFDDAVEARGLTKIKTNGDSYIVAAGLPEPLMDHAGVLTELALEMQRIASEYAYYGFRMGINSGPAVAGVIGKRVFIYDIWGDTVNTAARIESGGAEGRVNISEATYQLIKDRFHCVPRGKVEVKNKGLVEMYFVEGPREA